MIARSSEFTCKIATSNGHLVAVGTLSGTARKASGAVVATVVNRSDQFPLSDPPGTCTILHLVLGPIHLNVLGLHIDTNRIIIDITAHSGPGQLLGNLLCAITGLLDSPNGLAQLLNQILAAL